MTKKSIFNSIIIIIAGLVLSTGISYAVNPATSNPGGFAANNTPTPINIGAIVNSYQTKIGTLSIGPLVENAKSIFNGDVNILGFGVQPPNNNQTGFNDIGTPKFSLLEKLSTPKAYANTCNPACTSGFTCDPNSLTCVPIVPPAAPTIIFQAHSNYSDGANGGSITIPQNDYAYLDWNVSGTSPVACVASASPSTSEWTGSITPVVAGSKDPLNSTGINRTYTLSCTNQYGSTSKTVTINVLAFPNPSSNLSVSGKVGLGNYSSSVPVENLEVDGKIKVDLLQYGSGPNLCANASGKFVLCGF